MGTLEQVMQMKNQGMSDEEIAGTLQQQGISPKEITDAMNQAQIKNAVYAEDQGYEAPSPVAAAGAEEAPYTPQTQEMAGQGQYMPEQGYYQEQYAAPAAGIDSDTIIEIANQVFSEKIKKSEKTIDEFNEFKALAQVKIDSIDDRLKRIEKIIDTIQIKILEKIGSYGEELSSTKKEMSMMQESFRKAGIKHKKTKSSKKKR
jgi:transcriptional regulator